MEKVRELLKRANDSIIQDTEWAWIDDDKTAIHVSGFEIAQLCETLHTQKQKLREDCCVMREALKHGIAVADAFAEQCAENETPLTKHFTESYMTMEKALSQVSDYPSHQ